MKVTPLQCGFVFLWYDESWSFWWLSVKKNTLNRAFSLLFVVLHTKVLRYFFLIVNKGTVFFFPRKSWCSLTHLISEEFVFFFRELYFSFRPIFSDFWFFFPKNAEVGPYRKIHSKLWGRKRNTVQKKNTPFYSLTRFYPKCHKNQLLEGKKIRYLCCERYLKRSWCKNSIFQMYCVQGTKRKIDK